MFKIAFATATAVLVAATFGASAHAGGPRNGSGGMNGTSMNGLAPNGMSINGMGINGVKSNALHMNALHMNALHMNGWQNGIDLNGTAPAASAFAIDGVELPAQVR